MRDVRDAIRAFILANYLRGESPENLGDDTRLISSGILDSLAALELATFLEREFGVELSAVETMAESFDRIQDIAAIVERKSAA